MTDTINRVRLAAEAMAHDLASGVIPTASTLELLHALLLDGPSPEAIAATSDILKANLGEKARDYGIHLRELSAPWVAIANALTADA